MGPAIALLLALQVAPEEAALRKGAQFLRSMAVELGDRNDLLLWTLVSARAPESDPLVQTLLKPLLARPPESTRDAALQAMVLQLLDPVAHRDRLAHCAQFLIDNQAADGRWGPGSPVALPQLPPPPPPPKAGGAREFSLGPSRVPQKITLARRGDGPKEGDAANSLWATLGLSACLSARITGPREIAERAAAAWRTENADPADMVSGLTFHLYVQGRNFKKDPDILIALHRLADPARPADPRSLAALKRAMLHYDSEKLVGREWWPEGIKILLAAQKDDGSWGSIDDTCAAIRYLHLYRVRLLDERIWRK
jgi:hypothetical protein